MVNLNDDQGERFLEPRLLVPGTVVKRPSPEQEVMGLNRLGHHTFKFDKMFPHLELCI